MTSRLVGPREAARCARSASTQCDTDFVCINLTVLLSLRVICVCGCGCVWVCGVRACVRACVCRLFLSMLGRTRARACDDSSNRTHFGVVRQLGPGSRTSRLCFRHISLQETCVCGASKACRAKQLHSRTCKGGFRLKELAPGLQTPGTKNVRGPIQHSNRDGIRSPECTGLKLRRWLGITRDACGCAWTRMIPPAVLPHL